MKIGFIHYGWRNDGVSRVVLNNIEGLFETVEGLEIDLIGGDFISEIPKNVGQINLQLDSELDLDSIVNLLHKTTKEHDALIIENPSLGNRVNSTQAYKKFSEETEKRIIWRHHDIIDDRPKHHERFLGVFEDFSAPYARTENVKHVVLTNYNKKRFEDKGIEPIVLSNSIILEEFSRDYQRSLDLRKILERDNVIKLNEKILAYPSRIIDRKNIEEALLLTKLLNQGGEEYRLVVTMDHDKVYEKRIRTLAEEFNIPYSFGQLKKYISFDKNGFGISDLYGISESAITTSVDEGFGYGFIEPMAAHTPLIGRDLPLITEDFKNKGVNLSALYKEICPRTKEDARMELYRQILSSDREMRSLETEINLSDRISIAKSNVPSNYDSVINGFSHLPIARELYSLIV